MNFEDGLIHLQGFIRKRPMLIVGTGLSLSMGLPGMGQLLEHLERKIPELSNGNSSISEEWESCVKLIKELGFEEGLNEITICDELLELIVNETAELVHTKDLEAFRSIPNLQLSDFPFAKLLKHLIDSLPPDNQTLNVITPNYDHLVEYACDLINVDCCTGFKGTYLLKFDPANLRNDNYRIHPVPDRKGNIKFKKVPRVRLLKPHGSLHWQKVGEETYESFQKISGAKRVIITPGSTKFKSSLTDSIMNFHREMANNCIQNSNSLIIIGYGFNDVHLQTVLQERLRAGLECLILTKWLSPYARKLISTHKQIFALEEAEHLKTKWYFNQQEGIWDDPVWSLQQFVKRIL